MLEKMKGEGTYTIANAIENGQNKIIMAELCQLCRGKKNIFIFLIFPLKKSKSYKAFRD